MHYLNCHPPHPMGKRSKIEKLKLPKNPKGNFGYQDEDGVKLQMWELAEKINEIIDHLNFQAQTEELFAPVEYKTREQIEEEIRKI